MDGPIPNTGELAIIHNSDGTDHPSSTQKIHTIRNIDISDIATPTPRSEFLPGGISQAVDSARASLQVNIPSTNIHGEGEPTSHHHIAPTENIQQPSGDPQHQTTNDGDTGREHQIAGRDICHTRRSHPPHRTARNQTKQRAPSDGESPTDSHLGNKRRRTSSPSPSTSFGDPVGEDNTDGTDNVGVSYTFIHKPSFGVLPPTTKKLRVSPLSTTATTSTSSSQSSIPTTPPATSTPSLTSFAPLLRDLQRRIQHFNSSASSPDSFHISYVKVSELSISMDVSLSPSSNH
jgi:hypothetical protein